MINNKEMEKEMLLEANATISSIKSLLIKLQTHDLSDEAISLIQEAAIGIGDAYVNLHLAGRKLNG